MRTSFYTVFVALSLLLSGCLGYDGDLDHGYQVDRQSLDNVQLGITNKRQILDMLGTPSTTSTVGGDAWYYISRKEKRLLAFMPVQTTDQNVVAVYFNKGGTVSRIADYGMKDGKVFDFVSRTTPTEGQEPSFVRNILQGLFRFQM